MKSTVHDSPCMIWPSLVSGIDYTPFCDNIIFFPFMKKPKFNFQESSKTIYDFMMAYFLPHWDFLSVLFNAWDIALQCAAPLRKLKGVSYIRKGVFPCKISWHTLGNHSNCAACINYTPSKTSRHSNGESLPLRRQKMDLQTLHWTSRIAKKTSIAALALVRWRK